MNKDVLLLVGRLLLAVFFVSEAVDKIRRFSEWTAFIADAGMPLPAAEMVLVIVLLVLGSLSLVTGWRTQLGATLLVIFLVPTALLFESTGASIKSASLIGALLLVMATGPGRLALGAGATGDAPSS